MRPSATLAVLLLLPGGAPAAPIVPLDELVKAGDVLVTDVRGSGHSTGPSLHGRLVNTTARPLRISVHLSEGLFFSPGHSEVQNMLATAVYGQGGTYYEDETGPFIELPSVGSRAVTFNAYCVDFERDNPGPTDSMTARQLPLWLTGIAGRLLLYERSAQTDRSGIHAQIALWLTLGQTPEEIQARFPFGPQDLAAARRIAGSRD